MSAAAARRRKQLAARNKKDSDVVGSALSKLLEADSAAAMTEETAYEALQLAQSQIRKKINASDPVAACDLCYTSALTILQNGRVSVASQLLSLLVDVLRETQTTETPEWIQRLDNLHQARENAIKGQEGPEAARLDRLQRDWLRQCAQWSSDFSDIKYGNAALHALLGLQSWKLANSESSQALYEEEIMDFKCDAVVYMAMAEQPDVIIEWLASLPPPTPEQCKAGHDEAPALRDELLTRALLCMCAVENLRDANKLMRGFLTKVETRDSKELAVSYSNKKDGQAPSATIFGCMLLRVCEKDTRTGPLFSWLLRSFSRELNLMHKEQVLMTYTTKIGKIYFNIQPPPSMLNMMENMMSMMGGAGGMGGGAGGMNPAMMQAAMAQMGGMK